MSSMTTSRRALLQALTVGAGSLAFGLGRVTSAKADVPGKPRRLVVFPNSNGIPDTPSGYLDFGKAGSSPTDFQLGAIMKPVDDLGLRGDFVGLEGLEMRRPAGAFDTHWCGVTQLLTGPTAGVAGNKGDYNRYISSGPSIDQYLASKLFGAMPWPTLLMGTLCGGVSYSHAADGKMIAANRHPLDVYNSVFGALTPGGPDPALLRRLARRKSVLDAVTGDLKAFRARLPAEDQARADAQADAIRRMENRLAALAKGGVCDKPSLDQGVDYAAEANLPATMRAFIDLTVAAFACDQTRVVVMHDFISDGSDRNPRYGAPFDPVNAPGNGQHGLSHNGDGSTPAFEGFRRMKSFNTRLACELAQKLKTIPEPGVDGQTMLDNTIIYMPTEIGRGHTPVGLQFATLGGKGLGVKTGQYLKLANDLGAPLKDCVPNQRMLVTLLNAMGVPDGNFGEDPTLNTGAGPIAGYGSFG